MLPPSFGPIVTTIAKAYIAIPKFKLIFYRIIGFSDIDGVSRSRFRFTPFLYFKEENMERLEALTNYYTTHDEDVRLAPKRGQVEFLTTVHYVEKYLKPGMRIIEIGAGTGRY